MPTTSQQPSSLGAIGDAVNNAARQAYNYAIPPNARFLGELAAGVTSPITEKDFTPGDIAAMRQMYTTQKQANTTAEDDLRHLQTSVTPQNFRGSGYDRERQFDAASPTGMSYKQLSFPQFQQGVRNQLATFDKTRGRTSISQYGDNTALLDHQNLPTTVYRSYADPEYRVATTLGRFKVHETPQGLVARDNYNFDRWGTEQNESPSLGMLVSKPVKFFDTVMRQNFSGRSRPVEVNLGGMP